MKKYIFILLLPLLSFSQEEQLRVETIDVFKDYVPAVSNSIKISEQPIFNDTLNSDIISNQSILNQKLSLKESLFFNSPEKFRISQRNKYFTKYLYVDLGTNTFLNTKFHYTNAPSVRHNSGFYVEHNSEAYGLKSPYYKGYDGELFNSIGAYSNRFFKNRLLESSIELTKQSGLYWGGIDTTSIDQVDNYIGNNLSVKIALNGMSNEKLLRSINLDVLNFSNNHERREILLNTSVQFQREKALKTYSLLLGCLFSKTDLQHSTALFLPADGILKADIFPQGGLIASNPLADQLLDFGLSTKFIISGTKIVDYSIGFNMSYFKIQDIYSDSESDNSDILLFPPIAGV